MMRSRLRFWLIQLPVSTKRAIVAGGDVTMVVMVLTGTQLLLGQYIWPLSGAMAAVLGIAGALTVPVLASQHLYRAIIRFIGVEMMVGVLRGMALVGAAVGFASYLLDLQPARGALALGLVFWAFASMVLGGVRLLMRFAVAGGQRQGERIAIYGAGDAGRRLVAAAAKSHDMDAVLFFDDDPKLHGRVINGVPVAAPADLPALVERYGIERILLALPSAGRRRRQQVLASLEGLRVHVQTVPDIGDLLTGKARLEELREVCVADILGRDQVAPNTGLLDTCIRGKSVMVTGAGGSIGSELCRQIIELGARRLVLFELSELALYNIEQELRARQGESGLQLELVALLGSVHHRERVRRVIQTFGVQTVFHAAAYKHVPIVEYNMTEGVHNNVIGTWYAAEAAEEAGVETFVLVSTDKAVRPVNVMGATKRFAELVLQSMAERGSRTRFCMVRFGNVLESSGSVVPLFREQIRKGGPVTVTHPEVTRYFMTIPEAAHLVIQAAAMARGGDVFVLNMGEPVRIADLAERMIRLTGLSVRDAANPDGDIVIEYTGLRPGEKLYEDLLISDNVAATDHPMILRAYEERLPWATVQRHLQELLAAAGQCDCDRIQQVLLDGVHGYEPVCKQIEDLVWQQIAAVPPSVRRTANLRGVVSGVGIAVSTPGIG